MTACKNSSHEFYPVYGVAPHDHIFDEKKTFIGSTRLKPKKDWPKNFKEDPDCAGCGTYECPECLGKGE